MELPSTTSPVQTTPTLEVDASTVEPTQWPSSLAVERVKPVSYSGYSNEWCCAGQTVLKEIDSLSISIAKIHRGLVSFVIYM